MLCSNRPEGFGPLSHLYSHSLTSCFLDTIFIPLCTWLYFTALIVLTIIGAKRLPRQFSNAAVGGTPSLDSKVSRELETDDTANRGQTHHRHSKTHKALSILYYLLILANFLMCILEIVRLSLTHLGIGLLPFTLVVLITAGVVRFSKGIGGKIYGWSYLNLSLWIALAVTNGVKIAEETKEGSGARKGSKYPVADEITDVSVMIGVYVVLAILEIVLSIRERKGTVLSRN